MATPEPPGLLIVGSSQAGVQLVASLRALGYEPPITLLGDEKHRPYQRPALSKEFLQGEVSSESLIFRTPRYWAEHRVTLVTGERIVDIKRGRGGSGTAVAQSGRSFDFDRVALAVGARSRLLEVPDATFPGILYLRNADDALELKARIDDANDVVVVGGGFIGLEAAASCLKMGKKVTVLEAGSRLVGRAVGSETSEFLLDVHRKRGIHVELDSKISGFTGSADGVSAVELADGRSFPADLVLIGIGVVPNTELAQLMGLDCDNGIKVDSYALASDGTTIAVGDCANLPNPVSHAPEGSRIRLESVNNAIEQAKVAAYSLVGEREHYSGVPWFWSNQGDLKLQIAGLSAGYDYTAIRKDDAKGKFSVLYYRQQRIIAADCVNHPLDFMAVKNALSRGLNIPADLAANTSTPLKTITVETDTSESSRG